MNPVAPSAGVSLRGGKTQPGLDTLRRLALGLNISADRLLFDEDERGPGDELALQFEAASRLDPDELNVVRELIEGCCSGTRPSAGRRSDRAQVISIETTLPSPSRSTRSVWPS
jgi:transcriptional regulator with XRE-family HTH domain